MEQTPIMLPAELKARAKKKAKENYESLSSYIRRLILADLKKPS